MFAIVVCVLLLSYDNQKTRVYIWAPSFRGEKIQDPLIKLLPWGEVAKLCFSDDIFKHADCCYIIFDQTIAVVRQK